MARIDMDAAKEGHISSMIEYMRAFGGKRFHLIITDNDELILRPSVTTKGIDTVYMKNITGDKKKEIVDQIKPEVGAVFKCAAFRWSDDVKEKRTEDDYL
jgi:hypothetical protein